MIEAPSDPVQNWVIAFESSVEAPRPSTSRAAALAQMILEPELWPKSPMFWVNLSHGQARYMDALGSRQHRPVRPYFYSMHHIAALTEPSPRPHRLPYCCADFWFVARFLEAARLESFRWCELQSGGSWRSDDMLPTFEELKQELDIRRRSDWRTNFMMIFSPVVLDWLGVVAVDRDFDRDHYVRVTHRIKKGRA